MEPWAPTGENACGIVPHLSAADHITAGTGLVLGLPMLSKPLKQRASRRIVDAVADVVCFGWVPNVKVAQIELEALKTVQQTGGGAYGRLIACQCAVLAIGGKRRSMNAERSPEWT
jgi:hypothetical protein